MKNITHYIYGYDESGIYIDALFQDVGTDKVWVEFNLYRNCESIDPYETFEKAMPRKGARQVYSLLKGIITPETLEKDSRENSVHTVRQLELTSIN